MTTVTDYQQLMEREEARALGMKRYFTGRACRRGHIAERLVSVGSCCACRPELKRKYYYRDIEKSRARGRMRHHENPSAAVARVAAWRRANPEKDRAQRKRYGLSSRPRVRLKYQARIEEYRSKRRERYRAEKQKYLVWARNRKARKRLAAGKHTSADIAEILKLQRGRCAYCRRRLKSGQFHVDHIVPLISGGSNDRTNLQATCPACNLSKGIKDPVQYAQECGFLL